jgi:hypothetical protein
METDNALDHLYAASLKQVVEEGLAVCCKDLPNEHTEQDIDW